jgi:hypothetical protein
MLHYSRNVRSTIIMHKNKVIPINGRNGTIWGSRILVMYVTTFWFPLSSTTKSVRAWKVTPAQTITEPLPKLTFGIMLHWAYRSPEHRFTRTHLSLWSRQNLDASENITNLHWSNSQSTWFWANSNRTLRRAAANCGPLAGILGLKSSSASLLLTVFALIWNWYLLKVITCKAGAVRVLCLNDCKSRKRSRWAVVVRLRPCPGLLEYSPVSWKRRKTLDTVDWCRSRPFAISCWLIPSSASTTICAHCSAVVCQLKRS